MPFELIVQASKDEQNIFEIVVGETKRKGILISFLKMAAEVIKDSKCRRNHNVGFKAAQD